MNFIELSPQFIEAIRTVIREELEHISIQVPKETNHWLSIDELSNYLPGNPSKASLYAKVHSRSIPHKKMGKRLAFLKSEIDEWIMSHDRKTTSEVEADVDKYLSKCKQVKEEL